jgi:hypothetical protein
MWFVFCEDVANWLMRTIGTTPYLVFAFALGLLVPVLLGAAFIYLLISGWRSPRYGLLLGLAVAVWASLCWLVVPYCGAYPCLPGLIATMLVFDASPIDTLPEELFIHAVNFALWPAAGWLWFRAIAVAGHGESNAPADSRHD